MVRPQLISTDEIIEIARKLFFEDGLSVSMQAIADKVGLSQPALFKRFKTKKELIFAALAPPEKLPLIDWIDAGPKEGELRPQLEALLGKLWETLLWILPRMMVLKQSKLEPEEFHKLYKKPPLAVLLEAVSGWLERAKKSGRLRGSGDTDAWAQALLGSLQGRAVLKLILKIDFGTQEDTEYIKEVVDLYLRGMEARQDDA